MTIDECEEFGEATCVAPTDQKMCEAIPNCAWSPSGYCYGNCLTFTEMDACCSEPGCVWFEGACDYGGV